MATAAELAIVLKAKDEASAVLKKVSAQIDGLDKSGAAAGKGLGSLSSGFKSVVGAAAGIAVAVGGVAALTGAVKGAVGSAIDFEQSMSGIKAVSGATGAQMQQLSKLALDLGRDTSFSAGEAAAGISELVKGGVSIGDVFGGAASAALDLAAAGGVSVGEAATIAANAMNQFSLKGSDMAHVSDLVAGAANASSISVSDFNQSLAAGGSVAALAGQSIDSFATAVALMGAQGIKGSDAGTSLKAALNNLIPTTDIAKNKMRELGIITADGSNQFIDSSGKMKDFGAIAEILQTQTAGLTESQRLLALELIFGSDGMRAAGVLAKQGGEGFAAMGEAMGAAGGAAEIAREKLNNAAGDIEQLKGSLETAGITIGTLFIPAIRTIASSMTGAVNAFTDQASIIIETARNIASAHGIGLIPAAIVAVEQRIREVFGSSAADVFHDFIDIVKNVGKAFDAAKGALAPFASAFSDWVHNSLQGAPETTQRLADATNNLADALERNQKPVQFLAGAVAGLVAVMGTAGLLGIAARVGTVIGGLVTPFNVLGVAVAAWSGAYAADLGAVRQVTDLLVGGILAMPASFGKAFAENTTAIQRWFQESQGAFQGVIGAVAAMAAAVGGALVALAGSVGANAAEIGTAIITGIATAINPALLIAALINAVTAAISGAQATASAQAPSIGTNIVAGIVGGIQGGIGSVIAAAQGMAARAIAAAKARLDEHSPSKEFEAIGEDVDQGFIDGVEGMAPEIEAAVEGLMDGVTETAVASFASLAEALGAAAPAALAPVERAEQEFREKREDAERKHQRRMVDLEAELGAAQGKAREAVQDRMEKEEADFNDRLEDLARARGDRVIDLEREQSRTRADAVRDFQRGVEDVNRTLNEGLAANARKAGQAVSDAMRDAADSIIDAKDRASEAIADLQANQTLSRDVRAARDAFGAGQDAESLTRDRAQEDAEAEYRLKKDLEEAKRKLGKDRAKAETDDERREVEVRYAESVEDIKQRFEDAKTDLIRRRQIEDDDRAYRKQQQQALQDFNDRLEDQALQRQIKRLQDERDTRIKEIQAALDEKIARVRQNEKDENEALRKSADEKLNDLRTRFYDKVGELNEDSKNKFEALFDAIKKGVEEATKAANDLAEAINKAANAKAPSGSNRNIGTPTTWENQTQAVRDMFIATWGAENAKSRWEEEHARELGVPVGTQVVSPSGGGGGGSAPSQTSDVHAPGFDWGAYNAQNQGKPRNPDGTVRNAYGDHPLAAGQASRVGETGWAETFVPNVAGRLVTQDQIAMAVTGGQHGADGGYWEHGHDIVLDGVVVGRAVEPYVSGAQASTARLRLG